jgi:hypothetical protein
LPKLKKFFGKLFIQNKETKEFVTELFFLKREFLFLPFFTFWALKFCKKFASQKNTGPLTIADTTEFFN